MPRSSSSGASSSSSEVALGSSSSIKYRILKGNRDGKEYKTVVIGTQTWMAENLNYNASGSKCGDGKLLSDNNTSFCDTYGRLYDWSTAMGFEASCNTSDCTNQINAKHQGVCPSGWHIPSNTEWDSLFRYVDGTSGTSSPYDSQIAGKYLKSTSGWNSNGTDDYGFPPCRVAMVGSPLSTLPVSAIVAIGGVLVITVVLASTATTSLICTPWAAMMVLLGLPTLKETCLVSVA